MIKFTKMVASGNDFIVLESRGKSKSARQWANFVKKVCQRKFNIGADGVLLIEKSKIADIKMRIFNPDGREVEMCGNGARCAALYAYTNICRRTKKLIIETLAGLLQAEVKSKDKIKIKLSRPKGLKKEFELKVLGKKYKTGFINSGVEHTICFVKNVKNVDLKKIGSAIRYHKMFSPKGTNVDFVEIVNSKNIKVRTYERGVEDETLACGTGAVASAILSGLKLSNRDNLLSYHYIINVHTQGGDILKIYFKVSKDNITDVYLEGNAKIVYTGGVYV